MKRVGKSGWISFVLFPAWSACLGFAAQAPGEVPASLRFQGWWIENPAEKGLAVVSMENALVDRNLRLAPGITGGGLVLGKSVPFRFLERVRAGWGGILLQAQPRKSGKSGRSVGPSFLQVQTFWVPPGMDDLEVARKVMESEKRVTLSASKKLKALGKSGALLEKAPLRTVGDVKILGTRVYVLDGRGRRRLFSRSDLYCCGDRVIHVSGVRFRGIRDPFLRGGLWEKTASALRCVYRKRESGFFHWIEEKLYLGALLGGILGGWLFYLFQKKLEEKERRFMEKGEEVMS